MKKKLIKRLDQCIQKFLKLNDEFILYKYPLATHRCSFYKDLEDIRYSITFTYSGLDVQEMVFQNLSYGIESLAVTKIMNEAGAVQLMAQPENMTTWDKLLIKIALGDDNMDRKLWEFRGVVIADGNMINHEGFEQLHDICHEHLQKNIYRHFRENKTLEDIYDNIISKIDESVLHKFLGEQHPRIKKMVVLGLLKKDDYQEHKEELIKYFKDKVTSETIEHRIERHKIRLSITQKAAEIIETEYWTQKENV